MRLALLMIGIVFSINYGYAVLSSVPRYEEPTAEQTQRLINGELIYEYRRGRFVIVPAPPPSVAGYEDEYEEDEPVLAVAR